MKLGWVDRQVSDWDSPFYPLLSMKQTFWFLQLNTSFAFFWWENSIFLLSPSSSDPTATLLCFYCWHLSMTFKCLLFSPSVGDADPNTWLRSDEGMVPGDPREAARPQHHGFGKQQYSGHARRVLPRMQDRTVETAADHTTGFELCFQKFLNLKLPFLKRPFI